MDELDVIVRVFRKGWWIIPLMILFALAGVILLASVTTPMYRTTARLLIAADPTVLEGRDLIYSYISLDKASIVNTFVEIANSQKIRDEAHSATGLTPEQYPEYPTSAVVLPGTNIIQITASGPDADIVTTMADSITQETIQYVGQNYQGYYLESLDKAVKPLKPYTPNLLRDGSVAVFLAVMLGSFLAILYDLFGSTSLLLAFSKSLDRPTHALKRSYLEKYLLDLTGGQNMLLNLGIIRLTGWKTLEKDLTPAQLRRVLRATTHYIKQEVRGRDLVARWNADSYAVLMPGMDPAEAQAVLNRIQAGLQDPKLFSRLGEFVLLKPVTGLVTSTNKEKLSVIIDRAENALANHNNSDPQQATFSPVSG